MEQDRARDPGNVFAIPDLWGPTLSIPDPSSLFASDFTADTTTPSALDIKCEPAIENVGFFALPDWAVSPAETCKRSISPKVATPTSTDSVPSLQYDSEDEWIRSNLPDTKRPRLRTWDNFDDSDNEEPPTSYVTEAGAELFDACLVSARNVFNVGNRKTLVVESLPFASALLNLGLGRSSVFFNWNEEAQSFQIAHPNLRISGCTHEALESAVKLFRDCGNTTRHLQAFIEASYARSDAPTNVALADSISTVLETMQSTLSIPMRDVKSIIQLQERFRPANEILTCLEKVIRSITAKDSAEKVLSRLYERLQKLENQSHSLKALMIAILERVSRPWLDFSSEWIGMKAETGLPLTKTSEGKGFVKVEEQTWVDEQGLDMHGSDYVLDMSAIPSFMSEDEANMLFETGRSLRYLRDHSDHPITKKEISTASNAPSLDWQFTWESIESLQQRALQYESDLLKAVEQYSSSPKPHTQAQNDLFSLDLFGKDAEEIEARMLASIQDLATPLSPRPSDALQTAVREGLSMDRVVNTGISLDPPIAICSSLSFGPLIAAQARVVNGVSLRMFFESHKLREHLAVQREFQLLGNGVFSSRLAHALFDANLEAAESKDGAVRSGIRMGLRLENRESWPPASSELRLALMGILTESYTRNQSRRRGNYLDRKSELPGELSFSVREMSPSEIEQCLDVSSIYALDFLRLSYKPPAPLEAVITPSCLYKYDQIFKLLLRVSRLLFVVNQLSHRYNLTAATTLDPVAQRFCYESHNFITTIAAYFFDTGIDTTWRIFERKLDDAEKLLRSGNRIFGQNEGIDRLRHYHEKVLDRILFILLLRKRQQPIMSLLEDIFGLILTFSKQLQLSSEASSEGIASLYLEFRKKLGVFMTVCKGLSEGRGYGEKKGDDQRSTLTGGLFNTDELKDENTIIQLLVRLDIAGFYAKT